MVFSHIIALLRATHGAGFDRLAINNRSTGLWIAALLDPYLHAQGAQNLVPDAFFSPFPKVMVNRLPGRKVMRQGAPQTPTAQDIQDSVNNRTPFMQIKGSTRLDRWDQRLQDLPLCIR